MNKQPCSCGLATSYVEAIPTLQYVLLLAIFRVSEQETEGEPIIGLALSTRSLSTGSSMLPLWDLYVSQFPPCTSFTLKMVTAIITGTASTNDTAESQKLKLHVRHRPQKPKDKNQVLTSQHSRCNQVNQDNVSIIYGSTINNVYYLRPPIANPGTSLCMSCLALSVRSATFSPPWTIGKMFCVSAFWWAFRHRSNHLVVLHIVQTYKISKIYALHKESNTAPIYL